MEIQDYVPKHILELCTKYSMSRYRLSQKTEISQSALSDIIKGKSMPNLYTIEKICKAFGITLAQFFADEDIIPDLTSEQKEILDLWNGLGLNEKYFIKKCMQSLKE